MVSLWRDLVLEQDWRFVVASRGSRLAVDSSICTRARALALIELCDLTDSAEH